MKHNVNIERIPTLRFVVRRIEEDCIVTKKRILQQAVPSTEDCGYTWVDVPEVSEE